MMRAAAFAFILVAAPAWAQAQSTLREWREPVTGMVFVELPKGCFKMGSEAPVAARAEYLWSHLGMTTALSMDEVPHHEVCVDSVWLGTHEVRARDWERVMGTPPPAGRGDAPAAGMSWGDARRFAERLGERSGGRAHFRLPTEAEWEYACRAGRTEDPVAEGDEHVTFAWYSERDYRRLEPSAVGKLAANPWGLHDMLGNVWEWVEDAYAAEGYATHVLYNPVVKEAPGGEHVIRGASHRSNSQEVRCANRGAYPAGSGLPQIGLRLVRAP